MLPVINRQLQVAQGFNSPIEPIRTDYRWADEETNVAERDPFAVDPSLVERGLRGHAHAQNELARYLRDIGIEPSSPNGQQPNFDLSWISGSEVFVAEVKSLTPENEEKQLRLGLGQVLRFAHQMSCPGERYPFLLSKDARAILAG